MDEKPTQTGELAERMREAAERMAQSADEASDRNLSTIDEMLRLQRKLDELERQVSRDTTARPPDEADTQDPPRR